MRVLAYLLLAITGVVLAGCQTAITEVPTSHIYEPQAWGTTKGNLAGPTMTAHFIDVGQADATLLEFPCGAILIDAGRDSESETAIVDYLESFFKRRADLKRTLKSVIITHNHADHNNGIKEIYKKFNVKRYVHNGYISGKRGGSGTSIDIEKMYPTTVSVVTNDMGCDDEDGFTNSAIDPCQCDQCDPEVRVLFSHLKKWLSGAKESQNNHSMIVRVDFGESSFLFTGDCDTQAIKYALDKHAKHWGLFDVDVYQVGHHGAANGTTIPLMQRMTPEMAVISVGPHDRRGSQSAWSYGHPSSRLIKDDIVPRLTGGRKARRVRVAVGAKQSFETYLAKKALYATGWDGTIQIEADLEGRKKVSIQR